MQADRFDTSQALRAHEDEGHAARSFGIEQTEDA